MANEFRIPFTGNEIVEKLRKVDTLKTPNWNAAPGEPGYIEGRTHYLNESIEVFPFEERESEFQLENADWHLQNRHNLTNY